MSSRQLFYDWLDSVEFEKWVDNIYSNGVLNCKCDSEMVKVFRLLENIEYDEIKTKLTDNGERLYQLVIKEDETCWMTFKSLESLSESLPVWMSLDDENKNIYGFFDAMSNIKKQKELDKMKAEQEKRLRDKCKRIHELEQELCIDRYLFWVYGDKSLDPKNNNTVKISFNRSYPRIQFSYDKAEKVLDKIIGRLEKKVHENYLEKFTEEIDKITEETAQGLINIIESVQNKQEQEIKECPEVEQAQEAAELMYQLNIKLISVCHNNENIMIGDSTVPYHRLIDTTIIVENKNGKRLDFSSNEQLLEYLKNELKEQELKETVMMSATNIDKAMKYFTGDKLAKLDEIFAILRVSDCWSIRLFDDFSGIIYDNSMPTDKVIVKFDTLDECLPKLKDAFDKYNKPKPVFTNSKGDEFFEGDIRYWCNYLLCSVNSGSVAFSSTNNMYLTQSESFKTESEAKEALIKKLGENVKKGDKCMYTVFSELEFESWSTEDDTDLASGFSYLTISDFAKLVENGIIS